MIKAIVVMLIVVNAIRLVAGAVDYDIPSLAGVLPDPSKTPPTTSAPHADCSNVIFAFQQCQTEEGFFTSVIQVLQTIMLIIAFLLDMVLALFVVPMWLLALPGIDLAIKSVLITPLITGYGFIGYRLIRRG